MSKAATPRLKVFQAQIGFFDTVVAVPSQQAALRAWGTRQNLFAGGDAVPAKDEAAMAAALQHPGIVLRRAAGSNAPFSVEPSSLPDVPEPKQPSAEKGVRKTPEKAPPPADRSGLDQAEAALRTLETRRERDEADFEREQQVLDERRRAAQKTYVRDSKLAQQALADARAKYRKAGGKA